MNIFGYPDWKERQRHHDDVRKTHEELGNLDSNGRVRRFKGEEFFSRLQELGHSAVAEMCLCVGSAAPVWNSSGGKLKHDKYGNIEIDNYSTCPSFRKLRKEARQEAESLLEDEDARNNLLDTKVVNRIGQTAREYANGAEGLWTGLRRIKDDPEATEEQKLVLKMYADCEQTLGAGPVPEDLK